VNKMLAVPALALAALGLTAVSSVGAAQASTPYTTPCVEIGHSVSLQENGTDTIAHGTMCRIVPVQPLDLGEFRAQAVNGYYSEVYGSATPEVACVPIGNSVVLAAGAGGVYGDAVECALTIKSLVPASAGDEMIISWDGRSRAYKLG
jgi:hypothetical protein